MEILDWVINLFSDTVEAGLVEEELMELQHDTELKPVYEIIPKVLVTESNFLITVLHYRLCVFPTLY